MSQRHQAVLLNFVLLRFTLLIEAHLAFFQKLRGCFDFIVGSEKGIFRVLARLLLSGIAALWREKEAKTGSERYPLQPNE
jgi:hypothetical protein